jgi:signal transduction histidine kinase
MAAPPTETLLLSLSLAATDLAIVRARSREVGELVGLDTMQQTRLATAMSEIARNAMQFGVGGQINFLLAVAPDASHRQSLIAEVRDQGPGIPDIGAAMRGRVLSSGRTTMGLPASRRLVDRMNISSQPQRGTVVRLEIDLRPERPRLAEADLQRIRGRLLQSAPPSPLQEIAQQNHELLNVHQQLRDKQVALEKADDRKNQFVTTLAHELRSPLATLQMTIAILKRRPEVDPAELVKRCEVMERQTAQMTRLVDELMDAARVSQGKVELRKEPSELNALAARAVEMTGGAIAAKRHEVRVSPHAEALWVSADVPRLTQVICNLIQNSARYTPAGGRIEIDVHREGDKGVVTVADNGIGIAGDLLPHVFDLFVQGASSQQPGLEGGLGIGLTLVHHLVAGHGGEVSVASEGVDQGSIFSVSLPLLSPQPFAGREQRDPGRAAS